MENLVLFVRHYTRISAGLELCSHDISPERFPEVFGPHLPLTILSDRELPTVYRVELVRAWLKDQSIDRDALHEAIAQMSDKDQLQLRAALEQDSALTGALSSIDTQAGKISMHEP